MMKWLLRIGIPGLIYWQWQRRKEKNQAVPLKNKVVIITGASAGIGREAATIFSAQGAHTVLVARRSNLLAEVQQELQSQFDTQVLTITADLTSDSDIERIVSETLDHFGRIDVLVNNAGMTMGGYTEDHDPDAIRRMLDVNMYGLMRLTQAVLPTMKSQHSGHIVNVSSMVAEIPYSGEAPYAATKGGVNTFSEALRRELYGTGVQVSLVLPGWTQTGMIEHVDISRLRRNMMMPPGTEIQSAAYVASHVVAAVRYRRSTVRLGGALMGLYGLIGRAAPQLMDLYYALFSNSDETVDTVKNLGTRETTVDSP
jgi:short-subunit dehydrogenase